MHTLFHKREKESGKLILQQFVVHTMQCGINHSAVFCHMSAGYHNFNRKLQGVKLL